MFKAPYSNALCCEREAGPGRRLHRSRKSLCFVGSRYLVGRCKMDKRGWELRGRNFPGTGNKACKGLAL